MQALYQDVLHALQSENKEQAIQLSLEALETGQASVVDLYELVLSPALANIMKEYDAMDEIIWREHVRSGIVRSIIEAAYPYILAEREKITTDKGKVIIMCPEYEDHEMGARMVADYFLLEGFDATFIGARTPENTVIKAIELVRPKYLCISVTNYYNLISVKRTIDRIKNVIDYDLVFLVGGRAFDTNPEAYQHVGADIRLENYAGVQKLAKEER